MDFEISRESDETGEITKNETAEVRRLSEKKLEMAEDFSIEKMAEKQAVEDSDKIKLDQVRKKIDDLPSGGSSERRLAEAKDFSME